MIPNTWWFGRPEDDFLHKIFKNFICEVVKGEGAPGAQPPGSATGRWPVLDQLRSVVANPKNPLPGILLIVHLAREGNDR